MPEAVIVATARTPIGRAFKGSFTEDRADDMAAFIVDAALKKVPSLDRHEVDDLMLGCGLPGGEQGFNMARVVAILAGMRTVPGCTVTRYCSSSLQTIRMAAHAVRAGEGDVFVAAGVEAVSRFMVGGSSDHTPEHPEPQVRRRRRSQRGADGRRPGRLDAGRGSARRLHRDGRDRGERRRDRGRLARGDGRLRVPVAAARRCRRSGAGSSSGRSRRTRSASGTVVSADDCPRPDTEREKLASLAPAFRPTGRVTAGNACPLNDGAAAVVVMSDTRARDLGITPLARIVSSAA